MRARVTVALLAGAAVGLLAGVGARIAMRLVAVAGGRAPAFSVAGTLTVLVVGVLYGLAVGLVFVAVRRRLPASALGAGWRFGGLGWLLYGLPLLLADQAGELHVAPVFGLVLFSALFVLGGPAVALATQRIERAVPAPRPDGRTGGRPPSQRALAVLAAVALAGAAPAVGWTYVLAARRVVALLTGA